MVTLLFFAFGSGVAAEALAVFVTIAPAAATSVTFMVTVTCPLGAKLPALQVKVPVEPAKGAVHVPALVVKLAKVVPAGVVSLITVLAAVSGPTFATVIVYVSFVPWSTGFGLADTDVTRSAIAKWMSHMLLPCVAALNVRL